MNKILYINIKEIDKYIFYRKLYMCLISSGIDIDHMGHKIFSSRQKLKKKTEQQYKQKTEMGE